MKLPKFVTTFALICSKTKLPQFVTQAYSICNTYIYIFVIEFCCSYYNLCDLGWEYLTHRVTWLIDHGIMSYAKKALYSPLLGQWQPILAWCDLSWVDRNHRVMRLLWSTDHVIFTKKCISSFTTPMIIKLGRVMG